MKKGLFVLCIVFFILMGVGPAHADEFFRCGNELVSIGDSKSSVMMKCSQPMMIERAGSTVSGGYAGRTERVGRGQYYSEGTYSENESVVELWHYNCGQGQFNVTLTFVGGYLRGIQTSREYGRGLPDWQRQR